MDPMEDPDDVLRANRSREKTYMFDVAFDYSASQVSQSLYKMKMRLKTAAVFFLDMNFSVLSLFSSSCAGGSVPSYNERADRGPHIRLQCHSVCLWTHRFVCIVYLQNCVNEFWSLCPV